MRGFLVGLALTTLLFAPLSAGGPKAHRYYWETPAGPYWGAFGVYTATGDAHFIIDFLPGTGVDLKHDFGWGAGLTLGYQMGLGIRFEGELSYRRAEIRELIIGNDIHPSNGEVQVWGAMANILYEAECELICTPVRPYIGLGAGVMNICAHHVDTSTLIDDSSDVIGYQLIFGIGYPITKCWLIAGEYRFLGTTDWKFSGSGQTWEGKQNVYINSIGIATKFMM